MPVANNPIVVRNRYYKGKKQARVKLSRHLKYLEHRPRNQEHTETKEDRHLFDSEHDHISRKDATDDLMNHRANAVNYHALVLSPDPNEPVHDLREWTRQIMNDYAERKGLDLRWYAVQHYNTVEHPHVHVVLAGAAEDQSGKLKTVRIDEREKDITFLRASGFEHSDHELYRLMDEEHQREIQEHTLLHQEPVHEFEG